MSETTLQFDSDSEIPIAFVDPVGYLAAFGLEACLVDEVATPWYEAA